MDNSMSKIRLYGETSGYVELQAPDVANDVTITLPNESGPFATEAYADAVAADAADAIAAALDAIPVLAGIGSNVLSGVTTAAFTSTAATYTDVTGLTVTITPSSATSKVLLVAQLAVGGNSTGGPWGQWRFSGGNSTTYVGDAAQTRTRGVFGGNGRAVEDTERPLLFSYGIVFLDSPATTSATTYTVQARTSSGTFHLNRSSQDSNNNAHVRGASSITAIEVAA